MKILIVSDTHKKNENYFKVLEMHHPDMVIHCGDAEGSEYALPAAAKCPVNEYVEWIVVKRYRKKDFR